MFGVVSVKHFKGDCANSEQKAECTEADVTLINEERKRGLTLL